ncbi:MAG: cytochrome b/b6 domain-containing protein [Cyclonatronaceae bacterium]
MKRIKVYDLPLRIFHLFFALAMLAAFIIAKTIDDDSHIFIYHMIAGLTVGFLLLLRIIWGITGTKYSRFSSFKLGPNGLMVYLKDVMFTHAKRYPGHNPAASYAAVIMFLSSAGLIISGIIMTGGRDSDFFEEVHELLANTFIIAVIAHLAGVVLHQIRHRDSIWLTMLDGKKELTHESQGIGSIKPVTGILFFLLTFLWISFLITGYDRNTQTIDLIGYELNLGDAEHTSGSTDENDDEKEEEDDDH